MRHVSFRDFWGGGRFWAQRDPRERRTLAVGGMLAVFVVSYFFIIEPLQKRTQQQRDNAAIRLRQVTEMQQMAETLRDSAPPEAVASLLSGIIASESLENGRRLIKTQVVDNQRGKQLLIQLAPLGKVELHPSQQSLEVWFWENNKQ